MNNTPSLYIISTKFNTYVGYYTGGNVTSLINNEWEGMDVKVQLFYTHSSSKDLMNILKRRMKQVPGKEKDSFGFWTPLITQEELDSILNLITCHSEQLQHRDILQYALSRPPLFF